jgi:preprotein translocase subunit SecB
MSDTPKQQQAFFGLEKIYLKDVSFESPNAPAVFMETQAPEVGVRISISHRPIDAAQGYYEVVVSIEVNAKHGEKALFLVNVQQAGVFRIQGIADQLLERTLEVTCAYVLLPFAREAVNDFVVKGGFPQLLVNPINFDALYEQKVAAAKQPVKGQA